jgi:DMSO reductase anchor subunit
MRTVPAWRGFYTPLSFLGTALLLGPLSAASSYDALLDLGRKAHAFLDVAAIVALAAILLIILTIFLYTPGIGLFGPKKATLLERPAAKLYPYLLFRLLFLSGAVLCFFLYYRSPSARLLTYALLSACAAEVSGRLLFYAAYSRLGV